MRFRNGYFKEKKEVFIAKYTTKPGWFDVAVGTAVWYGVLVNYLNPVNDIVFTKVVELIPFRPVAQYFTWILIGIFFSLVGLILSYGIAGLFDILKRLRRKL